MKGQPRIWAPETDAAIIAMRREQGMAWTDIARQLGIGYWPIYKRALTLGLRGTNQAATPAPVAGRASAMPPQRDTHMDALPAGHPFTWGLLSDAPYPGRGA